MSNAPVKAVGWRILVEPVEVKKESDGGIALPQEAIKAQEYLRYFGRVVSMGELCFVSENFKPHPKADPAILCNVGDMVVYDRHAGQEVVHKRGDEMIRYKLISDDNVLAVVTDESSIVTPM